MGRVNYWKVTFFAGYVLLLETVLFHVLMYIHEFFAATSIISYAVLGIGLGSYVASRVQLPDRDETRLFAWCALGATASLWFVSWVVARHPHLQLIAAATALSVFFPVIYVAVMFREHPGERVYLYDMAGAAAGVAATAALYWLFMSESIALLLMAVLPALAWFSLRRHPASDELVAKLAKGMALLGALLLVFHLTTDRLNLFRLFPRDLDHPHRKVFVTEAPERLAASYDSLVERIDVVEAKGGKKHYVAYNGWANDHFQPGVQKTWEWFQEQGIEWPSGDQRVFYGLAEEPEVFIIGAAARGIVQTVKKITPVENITAIEIDPSIVTIMEDDFYKRSGRAYEGLEPIVGNALSVLPASGKEYDYITLINTHSGRTLGHRAGPDHLQIKENYHLYLDNLSEDGLILFEERPYTRQGMLGFYRELHTLWRALEERGVEDPARHFFIWDWESRTGVYPHIDLSYDEEEGRYNRAESYYIGMIVTREPLEGPRLQRVLDWYQHGVSICRILYLPGVMETGEVADVFAMIASGDFSPLAGEGFDTRVVDHDRPFTSLSTTEVPEIDALLRSGGFIFVVLTLLFTGAAFYRARPGRAAALTVFNVAIGFGYFLIEVMLLHACQNVFISPSWSLVMVLGVLLVSSGVGGLYTRRVPPWAATSALMVVSLLAIFAPGWCLSVGLPAFVIKLSCVVLIFATGFLMGCYFPRGLLLAERWGMSDKVPLFFALNSVAGSFAVLGALSLGVRFGYSATVVIAVLCYCVAGLIIEGRGLSID